jgi:hypothetical protein
MKTRRRDLRLWAVPLAVLLLAILAILALRSRPDPEARRVPEARSAVPAPARPRLAVGGREDPAPPAADEGEPEAPGFWEILVVTLPDLAGARVLTWDRRAELDPFVFWPAEGLPDHPSSDALEDLVSWEVPAGDPLEREWVDGALAALPELPDDEATALLALEAVRRAVRIDRLDALAEAQLALAPGEQIAPDVLLGPADGSEVEDAARALLERWPDGEGAAVARLYLVDAAVAAGDAVAARDAFRALGDADAAIRAQAASRLSRLDTHVAAEVLDPADREALGASLDADPEAAAELEVASFGLELALGAGDPVEEWLARLEDAWLAGCEVVEEESPSCAEHAANLDEVVARTGLREPSRARDWRQGLRIVAQRCAAALDVERPLRVETEARWDGAWTFAAWDRGPGDYTRCVEAGAEEVPEPSGPGAVRLTILGYPASFAVVDR